jgi:hypothetical protein
VNRVFYKTTYTLEVISEHVEPDENIELDELMFCVREGDWQASLAKLGTEEIDSEQAAIELLRQGKKPEVMCLSVDGTTTPSYWRA